MQEHSNKTKATQGLILSYYSGNRPSFSKFGGKRATILECLIFMGGPLRLNIHILHGFPLMQ